MAEVQWGLLAHYPNPGQAFNDAFQQGQQRRKEAEMDKALQALAANPQDPNALQQYARYDPRGAMSLRRQQEQDALKRMEADRDNILKGAQIFRSAKARNPGAPDAQVYASILPVLQQLGMDVSQLPPPDSPELPQYLQGILSIADALDPQAANQGFTLSEGQVRYGPDGRVIAQGPAKRPRYYPVPQGGRLELDPSFSDGGDDEWEIIGGPTPTASGGFPGN